MDNVFFRVKANNLSNVASSLFVNGKKTKLQIASKTFLSNTTVSDVINGMSKIGFVKVVGHEDSAGGRKSAIYSIDENYGQTIGIVLNKKRIVSVVTDMLGDILYTEITDINKDEKIINQLLDFLSMLKNSKYCNNLIAIGICLNGKIGKSQTVIECNDLNWNNVHLKEIVERRMATPTFIDHTVNALTFMELVKWKNIKNDNFLIAQDENGIRCSIYLDNEIIRGDNNYFGKTKFNSVEKILEFAKFMNIKNIIFCFQNNKRRNCFDYDKSLGIDIATKKINLGDVAEGMAIQAEMLWFKSIYFLLG